jgi:hypothetical protein
MPDDKQQQVVQADAPQDRSVLDTSINKQDGDDATKQREKKLVDQWTKKIIKAREKWEPDFKTMREDMKFARGLQWPDQKNLMDDRYVANLTLRNLSNGVAQLYARNPEVEAVRRDRLDFELWDGKEASIAAAAAAINLGTQTGQINPLAMALLKDYSEGQLWRDLVDRVGKTVRFVAQYMWDSLQPTFKIQMKQLVRRVKTCGVAYVQVNYVDGLEGTLSTSETESTIVDRVKRIKHIAEKLSEQEIDENSSEVLTLASSAMSVLSSISTGDTQNINQRITFDFLPSTSVIVDPRCRHLKGFVGARWLAIERIESLDLVNLFYETKIPKNEVKAYDENGVRQDNASDTAASTDDAAKTRVCIWDIYDLDTKSCFVICDGWKEFVQEPQPVVPETNHFWPVVAVTFNDVETEPSSKECGSIFPPSDVTLMRSPQKEWNRTREALRSHRIANTPAYFTGKGWLTDNDIAAINDHEDSAVVQFEGAQMGTDINKLLAPFQHSPLQPQLYDTAPLAQDIQLAAGTQETDLGRPVPKVTATGATIAEQSKNTVAASNTDDLDDFLSEIAQMEGEIILRYFKLDTVKRIAGRGAVLPQQNREDFLNEIMLSVKAASSGRPNQALEISKVTQLTPLWLKCGANPIGVCEIVTKAYDDRFDISKLYPLQMPMMAPNEEINQPSQPQSNAGIPQQGQQRQAQPVQQQ